MYPTADTLDHTAVHWGSHFDFCENPRHLHRFKPHSSDKQRHISAPSTTVWQLGNSTAQKLKSNSVHKG